MSESIAEQKARQANAKLYFKRPAMKTLDIDHIIDFFKSPNQSELTKDEIKDIDRALTKNRNLRELNSMLKDFISLQDTLDDYAGLSREQKGELKKLYQARESFRATHAKGKYNGPAIKSFIQNEKLIVPYTKTIQWWQFNSESLSKLSLWEELNDLLIDKGKKNHETDDVIKTKQYQLLDVKTDWSNQYIFNSISSEDLAEFYKDFVCVLEETIVNEIVNGKKHHERIQTYLTHLLYLIEGIKLQAIHAMLYRLQAIDNSYELRNDDTLNMAIDKVEAITNVNLRSNGVRPEQRHGLNAELIKIFSTYIRDYSQEHAEEKGIADTLDSLNTQKTPYRWQMLSQKDKDVAKLSQEPALLLAANTFYPMLLRISQSINADNHILSMQDLSATIDDINKLEKLTKDANTTFEMIMGSPAKEQNSVAIQLSEWNKRYQLLINQIKTNINISIDYKMAEIINTVFTADDIFTSSIDELTKYIQHANQFYRDFTGTSYNPEGDTILAISQEILIALSKGNKLGDEQINSIALLLRHLYPNNNEKAFDKVTKNLMGLSRKIKDVVMESDSYLLHLISHSIETPLMSKKNIGETIQRHQHIAKRYHEVWLDNQDKSTGDSYIDNLSAYVHNVSIKIARMSRSINLETFDDYISDPAMETLLELKKDKKYFSSLNNTKILCELQEQYENEIYNKINNTFSIKQFLYDSGSDKIRLTKLKSSLNAINLFFTNDAYKAELNKSIIDASKTLTKKYLIDCIRQDQRPDYEYLNKLNQALDCNLVAQMKDDHDLDLILKSTIDSYDGTSSKYSRLMVQLININSDEAYSYTKKRLDYIKSTKNISPDDYTYFAHAKQDRHLRQLFNEYKDHFEKSIEIIDKNKMSLWNQRQAAVIELFGSDNETLNYRFKRIRELLSDSALKKLPPNEQESYVTNFTNLINPLRLYKGFITNPSMHITEQTTLNTFMDFAGKQYGWQPIIEKIISLTGSKDQLANYHSDSLHRLIINMHDIKNHWLGKSLVKINNKDGFEAFLGKQNIPELCKRIETILMKISLFSDYYESKVITKNELDVFEKLYHTAQPLLNLYLACGQNGHVKSVATNAKSISDKVHLRFALSSSIQEASINGKTTSIDALTQDLMASVSDVLHKDLLSSHNVNDFISYCTSRLFNNLNKILTENKNIDFKNLMLVNSLLESISSYGMKTKLLNANKDDITKNPHWLTLINHFDETNTLDRLENLILDQTEEEKFSSSFLRFLAFSRHLMAIKQVTAMAIYNHLLEEVNIHHPLKSQHDDFKSHLAKQKFSGEELLRLWSLLIDKMKATQLPENYTDDYLALLRDMANDVSLNILKLAQNDRGLLDKFILTLKDIPPAYQETKSTGRNSLWASDQQNVTVDQMPGVAKKALALSLIHQLEQFALKKMKQKYLVAFRDAANDDVFHQQYRRPDSGGPAVKQLFHLRSEKDALILAHLIQVYNKINKIMIGQDKFSRIAAKIEQLEKLANEHVKLSSDKTYLAFLQSAKTLASSNPIQAGRANNDTELAEASHNRSRFSRSTV